MVNCRPVAVVKREADLSLRQLAEAGRKRFYPKKGKTFRQSVNAASHGSPYFSEYGGTIKSRSANNGVIVYDFYFSDGFL